MMPRVVIVGRPNVGKSSLFNLIAGRRISIVDPTAGVTRDRVNAVVQLPPKRPGQEGPVVELYDTGGYGIEDSQNLTTSVERQIANAIGDADLILFVVDAQTGILPLDEKVARLLRTGGADMNKIMLVCNKVDGEKLEMEAADFMRLGFGEPVMVSTVTNHMKRSFLESVREAIDFEALAAAGKDDRSLDPGIQLAIVGKRNAGKSTLVNAFAGEERVIVSEIEGTTRDSVDVRFEVNEHVFTAIDTAGVKKHKSIKGDIEYYSHHRSLRAIRRADVVLFMVDASLPISSVDKQLGNEVLKHDKPTVIVINKWDLVPEETTQEDYAAYLDDALKGLDFAPIVFLSAQKAEGLKQVLAMVKNLYDQAGHRVPTGELNRIVRDIITKRLPPAHMGRRLNVFYVTQLQTHPPTIGIFVNHPDLFDNNYERFIINRMRDQLPFSEVPIKLLIRGRKEMPEGT
ncbi:MAG TPA: ribosome biogenesis GTPase Der [Phycisphaerales bacterium]|nr:ribosome biogenesis GTPase Der [Phycisphaerales bacterium]|tara:strand:- start:103 stop:1476 length:1374 start_codon:yes stop_codon:yes gene_type:complete